MTPGKPAQPEPVSGKAAAPVGVLVMVDGTTFADYLRNAAPEDLTMDDWTRGYEECKRRLAEILLPQMEVYEAALSAKDAELATEREYIEAYRAAVAREARISGKTEAKLRAQLTAEREKVAAAQRREAELVDTLRRIRVHTGHLPHADAEFLARLLARIAGMVDTAILKGASHD